MFGDSGEFRARRGRRAEKRFDPLHRKLFPSAQRDSLEVQSPDLIAPQPAHIIAQCGEKLADLAFFPVMYVLLSRSC